MAFREIIGHERAIAALTRTLAEGREGASLIFHGPEGVGRRAVALSLAQALNCAVEPGVGCGRCGTCARIAHVERGKFEEGDHKGDARETTGHPDVRIVVPGKEEIRIDEIRSLRQQAQRRPFEGRRSVFIIDPAERMTTEAANALLKTLEEPPPGSCLILIASDPDALLPTVRSRCRLVPFHPLPVSLLAAHLEKAASMTPADALMVATLSGGRPGRALRFDLAAYRAARDAVMEVIGRLAERRPRAHVLKDAEILGSREDDAGIQASLDTLETLLRDAMVLHAGGRSDQIVNGEIEATLRRLGETLGDHLTGSLRRIAEARRDLVGNVNKQLLLEVLLLDLAIPQASARA
jgi:DNA polymerase-3 subunit delta'